MELFVKLDNVWVIWCIQIMTSEHKKHQKECHSHTQILSNNYSAKILPLNQKGKTQIFIQSWLSAFIVIVRIAEQTSYVMKLYRCVGNRHCGDLVGNMQITNCSNNLCTMEGKCNSVNQAKQNVELWGNKHLWSVICKSLVKNKWL